MTSASVINSADGHQYVVFVNTRLSPVQSTVSTLQTQFIIIAVVIIAMAIALAYYLSNRIARPILTTNDQRVSWRWAIMTCISTTMNMWRSTSSMRR